MAEATSHLAEVGGASGLRLVSDGMTGGGFGKVYRAPFRGGSIAEAMKAGRLTGADGWVYACIVAHASGKTQQAWPSRETIANQVGIHSRTVSRSVGRLERAGLIRVERRPNRVNLYHVLGTVEGGHLRPQGVAAVSPTGVASVSPDQNNENRTLEHSLWREKINQRFHTTVPTLLNDARASELVRDYGAPALEWALDRYIAGIRPDRIYSKFAWIKSQCSEAPAMSHANQ